MKAGCWCRNRTGLAGVDGLIDFQILRRLFDIRLGWNLAECIRKRKYFLGGNRKHQHHRSILALLDNRGRNARDLNKVPLMQFLAPPHQRMPQRRTLHGAVQWTKEKYFELLLKPLAPQSRFEN